MEEEPKPRIATNIWNARVRSARFAVLGPNPVFVINGSLERPAEIGCSGKWQKQGALSLGFARGYSPPLYQFGGSINFGASWCTLDHWRALLDFQFHPRGSFRKPPSVFTLVATKKWRVWANITRREREARKSVKSNFGPIPALSLMDRKHSVDPQNSQLGFGLPRTWVHLNYLSFRRQVKCTSFLALEVVLCRDRWSALESINRSLFCKLASGQAPQKGPQIKKRPMGPFRMLVMTQSPFN